MERKGDLGRGLGLISQGSDIMLRYEGWTGFI